MKYSEESHEWEPLSPYEETEPIDKASNEDTGDDVKDVMECEESDLGGDKSADEERRAKPKDDASISEESSRDTN